MITIVKGDDRNINLFFVLQGTNRPYDLSGWTRISVYFKEQFGGLLEKTTDAYDTYAQALYNGITFKAVTAGTTGNSISLVFDGAHTIQEVMNTWNTANPSNQVENDANDDSVILPAGTASLADAQDGLIDVTVMSAVLGQVKVRLRSFDTVLLLAGRSLSFKAEIDVAGGPPLGERRKIIFENALEIIEDDI